MGSNGEFDLNSAVNRILAEIPLVDKADLTVLVGISSALEKLREEIGVPAGVKKQISRAERLVTKIIMEEIPFDAGLAKLTNWAEKFQRGINSFETSATTDYDEETEPANENEDSISGEYSECCDDTRELRVRFASQLVGVLEDFEARILEYENGNTDVRNDIKRILHTWKGEFGVLDLQDYAQLIHLAEDQFEHSESGAEYLFRLKDFLTEQTEKLRNGIAVPIRKRDRDRIIGKPSVDRIEKAVRQTENPGKQEDVGVDSASGGDDEVLSMSDPSLMGDFITESRDHVHTAESLLLDLEDDPTNEEYLNSIFRSCHTIKGVSGFLGLKGISGLAHSTENLMDAARKGELLLRAAHIDLLLEAMDCIKEMINGIESGAGDDCSQQPRNFEEIIGRLSNYKEINEEEHSPTGPFSGQAVGEILLSRGQIAPEDIREALRRQKSGDERRFGEILIKDRGASARNVGQALVAQKGASQSSAVEETIRVPVERLDQLVDAIGEAVIAHAMIVADEEIVGIRNQGLERKISQSNTIMRKIQELSMSLRMVSVKTTFQKMARLVRDLSKKSGKNVEFIMEGEDTELDKSVVEKIGDPLIHMIRNSVDHGVEKADERARAGKPPKARIKLSAYHKAGSIYIEVADDGKGLDSKAIKEKAVLRGLCRAEDKLSEQEVFQFIFAPGFSTAAQVTDVSGRGVGMDVVKKNIQSLRGNIETISAPGKGSTFSIRLPLTLAIIDGMIIRLGLSRYIVPTLSIIESLKPEKTMIETVLNRGEMIKVRGDLIPLVRLADVLNQPISNSEQRIGGVAMIVEDMLGRRIALYLDEILGQQQVVIKSLGNWLGDLPGVSGGAIMSDGTVSLILDVEGVSRLAFETQKAAVEAEAV